MGAIQPLGQTTGNEFGTGLRILDPTLVKGINCCHPVVSCVDAYPFPLK